MLNQAEIIGHLGRDPEVRYAASGVAMCNFTVATTERWKDKNSGEQMEQTEWHRVSAFDRLAEICGEYLKKGSLVFIQGKITSRKYTNKDGVEQSVTEIRASQMKMLGGKPEGGGAQGQDRGAAPAQRQAAPATRQPARQAAQRPETPLHTNTGANGSGFEDMDDDIPF